MTIHRSAHTTHRRAFGGAVAVVVGMALLAACGSDDDSTADTTTTAAPAAEIEVTDAWARTSPSVATAGAVYMTITNSGSADDMLTGATVDPSVAAKVELHETTAADSGDSMSTTTSMGSGTTDSTGGGMMSMKPVDSITVPADGSVSLEPGGYHIMLLDLVEPLEVGTTIKVTLTFEQAGSIEVTADVRDTAP
jgi:copper(I)-binding protein